MKLKILAAITLVLILVLAWTQHRTIQNSNGASPAGEDLVEQVDDPQSPKEQTQRTGRTAGVKQPGKAFQPGGARNYSSSPQQQPAQTGQGQRAYSRTVAGSSSPAGAPQNRQYQNQERRARGQGLAYEDRSRQQRAANARPGSDYQDQPPQAGATSSGTQPRGSAGGPQGIAYEEGLEDLTGSYNSNVGNPTYRSTSQAYRQVPRHGGPGVYDEPVSRPPTYRPNPQPTPESLPGSNDPDRQAATQPPVNQEGYRKDGESENCIYRDGRIYCR